jgi:ABC-type phosphate transport system permease subunit
LISFLCKSTSLALLLFFVAVCSSLVYLAAPGLLLQSFWFSSSWNPTTQEFSFIPMLWGSIVCATIGTLLTFPVALGLAIGQKFLFTVTVSKLVFMPLNALASVPSILFGLLGLHYLAPLITQQLQLLFTRSSEVNLLSGGVTLALMTLPGCLVTIKATLDHFPKETLVSAEALGMARESIILKLVLPTLKASLVSCAFQAWSRGMGEAVALSMIIGRADLPWIKTISKEVAKSPMEKNISLPFFYQSVINPGQTIATKLSSSELFLAWGNPLHQGAIMALTVVLLFATVGVSLIFKQPSSGSFK